MKFKKMKCEHKDCNKEAEINICHNHINVDYPPEISREEVLKILDDFFELKRSYYSVPSTMLNKALVFEMSILAEELKSKISEVEK